MPCKISAFYLICHLSIAKISHSAHCNNKTGDVIAGDVKVTKYYFCIKAWLFTQIFEKFLFQTLRNILKYIWGKFKAQI